MKEIPLTQGKVALVDDADYERLSQFKWCAAKMGRTFYAVRMSPRVNGKRGLIRMHAVLVGKGADHIDGDGLNNSRANLRFATNQQNSYNAGKRRDNPSGFKGVSWEKTRQRWQVSIQADGKRMHLGYFTNPEDGAMAYDEAARTLHGEFARLNFEQEGR